MMEKTVLKAIKERSLITDRDKVVTVALSGGADSMALLNVLLKLQKELSIEVEAAHLNHLIRGEEAFRDEQFVTRACKELGVKLYKKQIDVPKYAKEQGISVELAARKLRYEFLEQISSGLIATAHNAGDNLETMLFNLTRGTGIEGLCGIPPKRDKFIRPLLLCTRAEIEEYCSRNNIAYVTDSTNLSNLYTRNKIRHSVTPVLREINPNADKAALRTAETLREINGLLSFICNEYIEKNTTDDGLLVEKISDLPQAAAKRVLKDYIEKRCDISLEAVHISAVYDAVLKGKNTEIPKKLTVSLQNGALKISPTGERNQAKYEYNVKISEESFKFLEKRKKINNLLLNNLLDCDKIVGKLVLRKANAGDSIRLQGKGCTKPLTKLFRENNIPLEERSEIPVISDDIGVVWVCSLGVAQRCAVTERTLKAFKIKAEIEKR